MLILRCVQTTRKVVRTTIRSEDVHERRLMASKKVHRSDLLMLGVEESLNMGGLGIKWFKDNKKISVNPLIPPLEKYLDGKIYKTNLGFDKVYNPQEVKTQHFPPYIPPYQDTKLSDLAYKYHIPYVLSTSTSTNLLSHLTFFLSKNNSPFLHDLVEGMHTVSVRYMLSIRKPITVILRKIRPGIFSLNNDQSIFDTKETILLNQGKIIENMLTHKQDEFKEKFIHGKNNDQEQYHRYAIINNEILIRSQIDCRRSDSEKSFFEIKSRAVTPIRYDLKNWSDYTDYEIKGRMGEFESFQRQYIDLVRGAFLKFCYQMMIGDMEGAFVAYHNTQQFYGCQFIKLQEFKRRLFGNEYNSILMLTLSCRLLKIILDKILQKLGEDYFQHSRLGFYSCDISRKLIILVQNIQDSDTKMKFEEKQFLKHQIKGDVHRFEMRVLSTVNGVLDYKGIQFTADHNVEFKYQMKYMGVTEKRDYMNFLRQAYKIDAQIFDFNYSGIWKST